MSFLWLLMPCAVVTFAWEDEVLVGWRMINNSKAVILWDREQQTIVLFGGNGRDAL